MVDPAAGRPHEAFMVSSPPSNQPWRDLLLAALLAVAVALGIHALTDPAQLGTVNDDAMYAVYARAIAEGHGYVDTSQPDHPAAVRYPILFPLMLALSALGATQPEAMLERMLWVAPLGAGAFVGLCFLYFRRALDAPRAIALGLGAMIALHPGMAWIGTLLLSDIPFAALALGAVMLIERFMRAEAAPSRWAWAAAGALIALACLTRYAGFVLLPAVAFALLKERRVGALAAVAAGFAVTFAPWLIFRLVSGGEEYQSHIGAILAQGAGPLMAAFGKSSSLLLSVALPGLLSPGSFTVPHLATFLSGVAISTVVLIGALDWLMRPGPNRTALAPAYLILTTAMAVAWAVGFLELGHALHTRLMLPVMPLVIMAFLGGLQVLLARGPLSLLVKSRLVGTVAVGAVVVTAGGHFYAGYANPERVSQRAKLLTNQHALFAAIREKTPETARVLSLHGPTVHWFTERSCYGMLYSSPVEHLAAQIVAARIDYVVGMPFLAPEPKPIPGARLPATAFRPVDLSVAILNELLVAYPELLEPIYIGGEGSYVLFKVRPEAVARLRAAG